MKHETCKRLAELGGSPLAQGRGLKRWRNPETASLVRGRPSRRGVD